MSISIKYESIANIEIPVSKNVRVVEKTKSTTKKPQSLSVFARISLWSNRHKQRKTLAKLDQRLLDDIGYTAEEARDEYTKPFWK